MRSGSFRRGINRWAVMAAVGAAGTALLVAGAVFFRLNLTGAPEAAELDHPSVGRSAPPYEMLNLGENLPYTSHDMIGKVVLLNFWATWCGPCVSEMPEYEALWKRYKDDPRFRFAAVNCEVDKNADAVKQFAKEHNWSFPVYTDLQGISQQLFGVEYFPTTILIDRNTIVRFYHIGMPEGGLATVEEKVKEALRVK